MRQGKATSQNISRTNGLRHVAVWAVSSASHRGGAAPRHKEPASPRRRSNMCRPFRAPSHVFTTQTRAASPGWYVKAFQAGIDIVVYSPGRANPGREPGLVCQGLSGRNRHRRLFPRTSRGRTTVAQPARGPIGSGVNGGRISAPTKTPSEDGEPVAAIRGNRHRRQFPRTSRGRTDVAPPTTGPTGTGMGGRRIPAPTNNPSGE